MYGPVSFSGELTLLPVGEGDKYQQAQPHQQPVADVAFNVYLGIGCAFAAAAARCVHAQILFQFCPVNIENHR
jgi:hypothetical protein